MKRGPGLLGAAIVLLCVAGVLPSHARSAKRTDSPVELKGTTRIVGSQPGYVTVVLPEDVKLRNPLISDDQIQVRGKGDFVGVALVGQGPASSRGHVYLGGRLPQSAGGRIFFDDPRAFYANNLYPRWIHIHRGEYRLYILPGKGEAEVQLRFRGLPGEVELHPTDQVSYEAELTEPRHTTPGGNYYAAGGTGTLEGRGIVFGAAWLSTSVHAATYADVCFWKGAPDETSGYAPTCGTTPVISLDNGMYSLGTTVDPQAGTDKPFRMHYGAWEPHHIGFDDPGAEYGQSVIIGSASAMESIGSMALWLSYD